MKQLPKANDEMEIVPDYANMNFNNGVAFRFEKGNARLWIKQITEPKDQTHVHFRGEGIDLKTGKKLKLDLDVYVEEIIRVIRR